MQVVILITKTEYDAMIETKNKKYVSDILKKYVGLLEKYSYCDIREEENKQDYILLAVQLVEETPRFFAYGLNNYVIYCDKGNPYTCDRFYIKRCKVEQINDMELRFPYV